MTRQDLLPGSQIAQSLHAFREFIADYPEIESQWYHNSNYIAILAAKDEPDLLKFVDRISKKGIKFSVFREPDLNNQLTAVALESGILSKKACSSFPLALRDYTLGSE